MSKTPEIDAEGLVDIARKLFPNPLVLDHTLGEGFSYHAYLSELRLALFALGNYYERTPSALLEIGASGEWRIKIKTFLPRGKDTMRPLFIGPLTEAQTTGLQTLSKHYGLPLASMEEGFRRGYARRLEKQT